MDIYKILQTLETLDEGAKQKFAGEKAGQKPGEQWQGTDPKTPGKKLVGEDDAVDKEIKEGWTSHLAELGATPMAGTATTTPATTATAPAANAATMGAQQAVDMAAQKKMIQDQIRATQQQLANLQKQLSQLSQRGMA